MPSTFDEDHSPRARSESDDQDQAESLWAAPIEVLRGAESVNRMVVRLFGEARRELCLFIGRPMLADDEVAAAFRALQERGVNMRQIVPRDFLSRKDAVSQGFFDAQVKLLTSTGKQRDLLPGKLIVVDRQVGLVSLNQESGAAHQSVVLRNRNLVTHLQASFEQHWDGAAPIEA